MIERSPLPMIEVAGAEHTVHFVNAAFCTLLGKPRTELIGRHFADIVCHGEKCVELLNRVYETGEAATHAEADTSEPVPAFWLYAMWPALNEKNHPERVVIQLTKTSRLHADAAALNEALLIGALRQHELREAAEKSNLTLQEEIAERRKVEAELQAAQAQLRASADQLETIVAERTLQLQASIGELEAFAYSLAHDLRAPVRAIHGFTQIMLEMRPGEIGPPAIDLLRRIITAATRMDSLIQDVLALTNVILRPVKLSSVDVDSLVHSLVHERPELAPPRAEITIESPLLPVLGHPALLGQCLAHLLSNAVKFVSPGTLPRVRVWTQPTDDSDHTAAPPRMRIWVEDEGIGIPPEARERIFEIFQRLHATSRYEGSGIGLAIVRKAVERMGGQVGLAASSAKGCRFWLEMPQAR